MAPHSSTLAWKIPWTEEPGRLQSMGSLRVRHDWSNLVAAAAVPYLWACVLFKKKKGRNEEKEESKVDSREESKVDGREEIHFVSLKLMKLIPGIRAQIPCLLRRKPVCDWWGRQVSGTKGLCSAIARSCPRDLNQLIQVLWKGAITVTESVYDWVRNHTQISKTKVLNSCALDTEFIFLCSLFFWNSIDVSLHWPMQKMFVLWIHTHRILIFFVKCC